RRLETRAGDRRVLPVGDGRARNHAGGDRRQPVALAMGLRFEGTKTKPRASYRVMRLLLPFRRLDPLTPTPLPRIQGRGAKEVAWVFSPLPEFGEGTGVGSKWQNRQKRS